MIKNKLYNRLKTISMLGLSVCILSFASCMDEDRLNKNPNFPDQEEAERDNALIASLFAQMQSYVIPVPNNAFQMNENLLGHVYGRYMATTNNGWNTANFGSFTAPAGWINSPLNDIFGKVYPAWFLMAQNTKQEGMAYAWGQVLRVAAMNRLTDMYGPIAYTEVEKNTGSLYVAYDSQEKAYKAMMEDLDNAIAELTYFAQSGATTTLAVNDKVYAGDFNKWVKFANSLKLRLALRMVYADPVFAKQKAEEAVSHIIGVIVDNKDNASIDCGGERNPIRIMYFDYTDSRVAAELPAYMNGYSDPRRAAYFTPSTWGTYTGLRVGVTIPNKDWALKYSTPTYLETDRLPWLNAAEVAFAKAEGVIWGWNMGGTAEDLYNEGVRLSFTEHKLSVADANTYLADATSTPAPYGDPNTPNNSMSSNPSTITIHWNDGDGFEAKQERILTQKWIAMWPLGTEAWSEQRRTGYPRFFPVVVNGGESLLTTRLASRIPFAPSEKSDNPDNYAEAVTLLGGTDNYSTRLWWDKKVGKPNF